MHLPSFIHPQSVPQATSAADWAVALQDGFVADASHLAALRISGADATSFLQGQLSCDVNAISSGAEWTFGAYCSPKGRMLASFILWAEEANWIMVLSRSIAAEIKKRLSMFILRAKVQIGTADDLKLVGIFGFSPVSLPPVSKAIGEKEVAKWMGGTVIAQPGSRFLAVCTDEYARSIWESAEPRTKTGPDLWIWLDIQNGIPWITARTQDQFVPQMVNLERIGGISFKKGCYPGQEIIARTQYLGKSKRHMFLAHVDALAEAGMPLHSDDVAGQANGMVVNGIPVPGGGSDVVVSIQSDSVERSVTHLGAPDGPTLSFSTLPYEVT